MAKQLIEIVYTFEELSDAAKARARDWYRAGMETSDYADAVIAQAVEVGQWLGITFSTHAVKLMNGTTRQDPNVFWSGFCNQGDGACFEGTYAYQRGAAQQVREYPQDTTLHQIAADLQAIQRRYFYRLSARVTHRGSYCHSQSTEISVYNERTGEEYDRVTPAWDAIASALRDFMNWIYRTLETEYAYQTADAQVDEMIRINEYTFTEEGVRRG